MKSLLSLMLFVFLFSTSCTNPKVVQKNNMKKVENSSNSEYSLNSKTDVKEVVTDPITMDRCDKKVAIAYEDNFFCSQQSLAKYKEQQ